MNKLSAARLARIEALEERFGVDLRSAYVEAQQRGMSENRIAQEWGVPRTTLVKWRRWLKLPFSSARECNKIGRAENDARSIAYQVRALGYKSLADYRVRRWEAGLTVSQMAEELGRSEWGLSRLFARYGIPKMPVIRTAQAQAARRETIKQAQAVRLDKIRKRRLAKERRKAK